MEGVAHPVWGSVCFILALLSFVALLDYDPQKSRWITTAGMEDGVWAWSPLVGSFGETLSFWIIRLIGFGGWLMPILWGWAGCALLQKRQKAISWRKIGFVALGLIAFAGLLSLFEMHMMSGGRVPMNYYTSGLGGVVGRFLYQDLAYEHLGVFGSGLVFFVVAFVGFGSDWMTLEHWSALKLSLQTAYNNWRERRNEVARLRQRENEILEAARLEAMKSIRERNAVMTKMLMLSMLLMQKLSPLLKKVRSGYLAKLKSKLKSANF
jgi:hypothetical protein